MRAFSRWFTRGGFGPDPPRAPIEVIVMRCFGVAWLVSFLIASALTRPRPGLHGDGVAVLLATLALLVAAATATRARRPDGVERHRIVALAAVTASAAVLAALQPAGAWQTGPILVGLIAALRLGRVSGTLTFAGSLAVVMGVAVFEGHGGAALSVLLTAVPWFLVMRLLVFLAGQRNELESSRAAEARAAAEAERGRLAREMHDVLAHSLSALALQLESTRLLAADRDTDRDVTRAIDQAHQLAVGGLGDARRAIATARGDELPGPDQIGLLADAFGQQSGLPVALAVRGEPRELAPDARLAVYRTAQEALTNVGRHAAAERVVIELAYLPRSTVLVVADHARHGTPPPAPLSLAAAGYGLTGMRERAELLGGQLLAAPTENGFRVELRLPA